MFQAVDIAKFQRADKYYFKRLARKGAKGAFVQINYGPWQAYDNPKASAQIYNSIKYLYFAGCYDFFQGYPVYEANHFVDLLKRYGMDSSTPVMLDVEPGCGKGPQTYEINKWSKIVHDAGYWNIWIYAPSSWLLNGTIKPELLHHGKIWAASYGTSQSGVANASAWQFTDNWKGLNTDGDYFFVSLTELTGKGKPKLKPNPINNYVTKGRHFKALSDINGYSELDFKTKNGYILAKGSLFYGNPINLKTYARIRTNIGYFSANKKLIKPIK